MDLNKVFENNQNRISSKLKVDPHYFEDLSKGQNPDILYIGCPDSRVLWGFDGRTAGIGFCA